MDSNVLIPPKKAVRRWWQRIYWVMTTVALGAMAIAALRMATSDDHTSRPWLYVLQLALAFNFTVDGIDNLAYPTHRTSRLFGSLFVTIGPTLLVAWIVLWLMD